MTESSVI